MGPAIDGRGRDVERARWVSRPPGGGSGSGAAVPGRGSGSGAKASNVTAESVPWNHERVSARHRASADSTAWREYVLTDGPQHANSSVLACVARSDAVKTGSTATRLRHSDIHRSETTLP